MSLNSLAELASVIGAATTAPVIVEEFEIPNEPKQPEVKAAKAVLKAPANVSKSKADKFDILKNVEKTLNAQFKTSFSIVRLGAKVGVQIPSTPTDLPSLDYGVLTCGGIPRGRIIEIFGPESCLASDTYIQYAVHDSKTGERINHKGGTIQHLYRRFHKKFTSGCGNHLANHDSYFTVPSLNEDDRIFHNQVEDVVFTGNKPCIRIYTDEGNYIEATKEHKFFSQGKFIEAGNLTIGSVVSIHNKTPFKCDAPPRVHRPEYVVKYHPNASTKVVEGNYTYYRIKRTRAVFEAHLNGISTDEYIRRLNNGDTTLKYIDNEKFHIHHIDEDCTHDVIENLVLISPQEHGKLHATERHNNLRYTAVDRIVTKIEDAGIKETFDIRMKSPYNNYVANKFVVHNSGKTTLALHIIACEQAATDNLCAVVDAEHALDPTYAAKLGVNVDELLISQPNSGEQALETVEALIDSKAVSIIVVDSVAALVPQAELEGEMGDSNMGLHARLMSQAMRKLTGKVSTNGITLIFINQIREKIGVMFGSPETTTGGRALKFFASVRLDTRRKEVIGDKEHPIGHTIKVKAVKNKVGPPMRETFIDLLYGTGIDTGSDIVRYGETLGVVEKSGAWYSAFGERLGQGLTNAGNSVSMNSDLKGRILKEIHKVLDAQREKENA